MMKTVDRLRQPRVLLTATIQVRDDMSFTFRRTTEIRLSDYRTAFTRWLKDPQVASIVFVENSGYDLLEFEELARTVPDKRVEILSFSCPPYSGSLGKGYGEMLCIKHILQHSELIHASERFLKVTGRYYVRNSGTLLTFIGDNRSWT